MQQNSDIQKLVRQLVQAAAQGNREASAQILQIVNAAEQGDVQAQLILLLIQQEIQAIQMAKRGAKLNYLKSLKGDCPEDEEVVYFKKGGMLCKKCEKAKQSKKLNAIEEFKKGKRMKKCLNGDKFEDFYKLKRYGYNTDTLTLSPGYLIISLSFYPVYERLKDDKWLKKGEETWYDFSTDTGRNIYVSPTKSDTIYFDRPVDYIISYDQSTTIPVGRSENLKKSKTEFNKKYKSYGPKK